jgi:hypothetical protein
MSEEIVARLSKDRPNLFIYSRPDAIMDKLEQDLSRIRTRVKFPVFKKPFYAEIEGVA